jgi:hypothetical protein
MSCVGTDELIGVQGACRDRGIRGSARHLGATFASELGFLGLLLDLPQNLTRCAQLPA